MKKLISMLSALTITSSTTSLAVACGNKEENKTSDKNKEKELKGEAIDFDKLTVDEIINVENEYKGKNERRARKENVWWWNFQKLRKRQK